MLSHAWQGYLVEHCRVGEGDTLQLELRERASQRVPYDNKKVPRQSTGTMICTKYSNETADAFWDAEIMPGLRKFCQVIRQLRQGPQLLQGFLAADDKQAWYGSAVQTSLVRS